MSAISPSSSMSELTSRVSAGDERARARLHATLSRHVEHIVRRALQRGDPSTSLSRKIAAAARRLSDDGLEPNELTGLVAENLRHAVVNRLWGGTEEFDSASTAVV